MRLPILVDHYLAQIAAAVNGERCGITHKSLRLEWLYQLWHG